MKVVLWVLALAVMLVCEVASSVTNSNANIVRPCDLTNLECIRENLAANSQCSPKVLGSILGAYTKYNFKFDTPFFNSTYIDEWVTIRNHDACTVSEFYFNKATDSAVLALDCPLLDIESNRTLIYHYSLKEDSTYSYKIRGTYPLIRLTSHIRNADALDICSAFIFADVTALPIFRIDPNNKPTANFLGHEMTTLNIYEQETFFYRGPSLFRYFINSIICDFGCN